MRIAIIPARGGSVRIPRKNIKPFFGKPIMAYSIETARASALFNMIVVSTDDEEIASIAYRYGAVAMHRPTNLALDHVGPLDVASHVLKTLAKEGLMPDCACVITATSPLVEANDLQFGLSILERSGDVDYVFGMGTEPPKDAGAWYWGRTEALMTGRSLVSVHTRMVPMPVERCCDINEPDDWKRAETLYASLHRIAA